VGSDDQRRRAEQLHAGRVLCERRGVGGAGALLSDVSVSAGLLSLLSRELRHCAALCMHCMDTVPWREAQARACAAAQVGERYQLVKLLGSGSFSSVCSALDAVTGEQARTRCAPACAGRSPAWPRGCPPGGCGLEKRGGGSRAGRAARALAAPSWRRNIHINMRRAGGARRARPAAAGGARRARARPARRARPQVALKRIPDVLSSPEQAKRVLREVCILRRLRQPFLINLRDAFTRPSSSGASAAAAGGGGHAAMLCVQAPRSPPARLPRRACARCRQELPVCTAAAGLSAAAAPLPTRRPAAQAPRRWSAASWSRCRWTSTSPWSTARTATCSTSGAPPPPRAARAKGRRGPHSPSIVPPALRHRAGRSGSCGAPRGLTPADAAGARGQLTAEEVRLMVWQLLHALKYLHANNVWHRDIKSSNVMLTRAHGHRVVKVRARAPPNARSWAAAAQPSRVRGDTPAPARLLSVTGSASVSPEPQARKQHAVCGGSRAGGRLWQRALGNQRGLPLGGAGPARPRARGRVLRRRAGAPRGAPAGAEPPRSVCAPASACDNDARATTQTRRPAGLPAQGCRRRAAGRPAGRLVGAVVRAPTSQANAGAHTEHGPARLASRLARRTPLCQALTT